MKSIYMNVTITNYNRNYIAPDCTYYESIDDKGMTSRKLTIDEARKLQWELVKAGATRRVEPNMFNNSISRVDVSYWVGY